LTLLTLPLLICGCLGQLLTSKATLSDQQLLRPRNTHASPPALITGGCLTLTTLHLFVRGAAAMRSKRELQQITKPLS